MLLVSSWFNYHNEIASKSNHSISNLLALRLWNLPWTRYSKSQCYFESFHCKPHSVSNNLICKLTLSIPHLPDHHIDLVLLFLDPDWTTVRHMHSQIGLYSQKLNNFSPGIGLSLTSLSWFCSAFVLQVTFAAEKHRILWEVNICLFHIYFPNIMNYKYKWKIK